MTPLRLPRLRTIALLAAALAALWLTVRPARADSAKRHVLYINSYQNGYTWSDDILAGIREGLAASGYAVDLQVEYLDTKRHPEPDVRARVLDLYSRKYRDVRFEVVLVSDNAAFNFILEHGDSLFPGVPVVFGGVNDFHPDAIAGRGNITGVEENPRIAETLALALRLHPLRRNLLVLGTEEHETSLTIEQQVRAELPSLGPELTARFARVNSLEDVKREVAALGEGGLVYVIPFYLNNSENTHLFPEEVLEFLSSQTTMPIYSDWDFMLGRGIVGGRLLSGRQQGRTMAGMTAAILGGEKPADIPVVASTQDPLLFDYRVVQRLGIRRDQLPAGSTFINEPAPFYELQKPVFWTIIASLVAMAVTLFFLASNVIRRRQVERTLISQLSFLRRLLDTLPQLVFWKDAGGRYQGANRAFAEFFGLATADEVVGKLNHEFMDSQADARRGEQLDADVLRTGEPSHSVVWEFKHHGESQAILEVNKVPLQNLDGKVVGVLTTAEDVTGRVSLERQLLQSQKMEAIGTFVGGIAHDFNNILTTVINSAELALLDLPEDGATAGDIRRALSAARQGSQLVKQIHTYGRPIQSGLMPTDLRQVVGEALGLVHASLPGHIRLTENLGEETVTALADPTQVHQVVMNLCTNAFQALQPEGGTLEVALAEVLLEEDEALLLGLRSGRYARLTVADDGPGIPAHIADKIFDPFFTTKGKGEGTGLGLAVVQGIVKGHKGAVSVESRPFERTAFHVYLPAVAGERAQARPEAEDAHGGEAPLPQAAAGAERILFVEDDPDQLAAVPRALRGLGYDVTPCQGARAAMDVLSAPEARFDLLVTDFDMPELSGVDLSRAVARRWPTLPVVMISGRSTALDAAAGVANIRQVVLKPYSGRVLGQAIRQVMDHPHG